MKSVRLGKWMLLSNVVDMGLAKGLCACVRVCVCACVRGGARVCAWGRGVGWVCCWCAWGCVCAWWSRLVACVGVCVCVCLCACVRVCEGVERGRLVRGLENKED